MVRPNSSSVTGNASRRVAQHREKYARLDVSVRHQTVDVIQQLAEQYLTSKSVVTRSLLRYALTNRDWKSQGLIWHMGDL